MTERIMTPRLFPYRSLYWPYKRAKKDVGKNSACSYEVGSLTYLLIPF